MSNSQSPFKAAPEGRYALAEVLLHIRGQALADEPESEHSWALFCEKAKSEAGLDLPEATLATYAPTPRYGSVPSAGLFYAIGAWGIFTFPNGQPITAASLYEVLMLRRHPNGDLIQP